MSSKKYKVVNRKKKQQTHPGREQTRGSRSGGGRGARDTNCEFNISYKDRVYAQGIEPVFANN